MERRRSGVLRDAMNLDRAFLSPRAFKSVNLPFTRASLVRGGAVAAVSVGCAFLLMANDAHVTGGVPLGALCTIVCAGGIVGALAPFDARRWRAGRTSAVRGSRVRSRGPRVLRGRLAVARGRRSQRAPPMARRRPAHGELRRARRHRLSRGRRARPASHRRRRPRAPAAPSPRLLARRRDGAACTCPRSAAARSGTRGRPTTARSRARSSRATTGSRSGGR